MKRIQHKQSPVHVRGSKRGRRVPGLSLRLTLALLPTLLASCQARQGDEANPTEIRSDGRFRWTLTRLANVSPTQQFEWLDNETILLIGVDKTKTRGLFAWDRKDKARLLLPDAYRLCFDGETWRALVNKQDPNSQTRSHIRYQINPKDLTVTRIGPMASPKGGGYFNIYTCNEEPYPKELSEGPWIPLRPEDGYILLGHNWERNQEALLVEPRSGARTPLGFRVNDPTTLLSHYSDYGRYYVLYDTSLSLQELQTWNKSGEYTIFSLTAPANIQAIRIKQGPWSEARAGDREFEIARHGIIISSKGGAPRKTNNAGIYIIRKDHTFTRLDNGFIESPTISANGCRLAYKRSQKGPLGRLTSINLCAP